MDLLFSFWFFVFGTIIGSFLNVVIYRFNTGKSLGGRSHCPSCGEILRWYELLPVVSYLMQLGRCRHCRAHITLRYACVEIVTAVLFVLVYFTFSDPVLIALNLAVVSLLVVITVYDIRHMIISDALVLLLTAVVFAYIFWNPVTSSVEWPEPLILFSGLGAAFFFAALWYVSGGRWIGLGDAKLALPLGVLVGITGVFSLVVLSFWIGAVVSLAIIGVQKLWYFYRHPYQKRPFLTTSSEKQNARSRAFYSSADVANHRRWFTMKSEVPFAPFLILSFFLVHFFSINVFEMVHFISLSSYPW